VTVLEKHDIPGGYATAFDRAGGKFRFEVSLEGTAIKEGRAGGKEILVPQRDPEVIRELAKGFPQEAASRPSSRSWRTGAEKGYMPLTA